VTPARLAAIPYQAWGNRGVRAMRVWVPLSVNPSDSLPGDADHSALATRRTQEVAGSSPASQSYGHDSHM
jgi:hypothetical protein